MKKQVTKTINVCDFCKKEDIYGTCTGCGKDICYDCQKTAAVEYPHSIVCSGSYDGLYCHACDERLVNDPLHRAYATIRSLRHEQEGACKSVKQRADKAEAAIREMLKGAARQERGE